MGNHGESEAKNDASRKSFLATDEQRLSQMRKECLGRICVWFEFICGLSFSKPTYRSCPMCVKWGFRFVACDSGPGQTLFQTSDPCFNLFPPIRKLPFAGDPSGYPQLILPVQKGGFGNRLTIDKGNERIDVGRALAEVEREWLFGVIKKEYKV